MRPAFIAIVITGIALTGCAQRRDATPAPDPTAPARAAFGDHMEPFQGKPLTEMLAVFGPPSSRRPARDGGEVVAWARKGETTVDGKVIPQDCTVTAFVDTQGLVSGIFGGGNILYCSKSFVPLPQALRPAAALPPPPPVIGQ